jgi:hypothetical protein
MKNNIVKALNVLKTSDIMSLVLFSLYKIKDVPEYATLSELAYLVDQKSLNNLIEYYGGTTIRIPTKEELILVVDALLLYELTKMEGMEFKDACDQIANPQHISQKDLREAYTKISEVLDNYDFRRD